jgi:Arc/MetJ-type ribon-helix-helix transcriptional regulator
MKKLKLLPLIVLLFTLVTVSVAEISPAIAKTPEPARPIPGLGKMTDTELRNAWLKRRAWYDSQSEVIRDAYRTAEAFEAYIEVMKKKHGDAYPLEVAVSKYYAAIQDAELARVEANKIFSRNAGFNTNYYILDHQLAGQSIVDVHGSLKHVHLILFEAHRELRKDLNAWLRRGRD